MSRVVHFEILADDPERASAFYRDVLGWDIQTWTGGEQKYWLVSTGSEDEPGINGGIMTRHFEQPVINTARVDSLDDALARVAEHGGEVVHGPNEVPGVGMHAYCKDTEGNLFGVMEEKRPDDDG